MVIILLWIALTIYNHMDLLMNFSTQLVRSTTRVNSMSEPFTVQIILQSLEN